MTAATTLPLNPTYRTHTCGQLRADNAGQTVSLSGWIFRKRDHGGVAFVDMRDNFGITQLVFDPNAAATAEIVDQVTHLSLESVIQITGKVLKRADAQINPNLPTGAIEVSVDSLTVHSAAQNMPYSITDDTAPEDMRLTYRFLDLRRDDVHNTILLRNDVVHSIRNRMWNLGFKEFQTPILTASSPEGARDFLVPSRLHPGKFYALPQAPQQFKQLLMVSGFDKYFQIAPCFRDEDARADRCPTDFYQLDLEMSFVEQEDVFKVAETVIGGVFEEFKNWNGNSRNPAGRTVHPEWRHIPYNTAMAQYACDKPDLRCPLIIQDCSDIWANSEFKVFKDIVGNGGCVRMIGVKGAGTKPRSWFDTLGKWVQDDLGAPAAPGYLTIEHITQKEDLDYAADPQLPNEVEARATQYRVRGPLAKFLSPQQIGSLFQEAQLKNVGDTLFFVAGKFEATNKILNPLRVRLGKDCGLNETNVFKFCWIVDFPMYEKDESTGKIDFSHNPFSMPQGGLKALNEQDPLTIKAFQYDLVCNGYELISGGIRNHLPEAMIKAFDIAGLSADMVKDKFRGMWKAFHLGAPPHGGCAAGLERVVMLLAESTMVREVVAFPMTQRGEDLLMGAPSEAAPQQLKDLHIQLKLPSKA
ncbi:MAG: aspartate--tRNA ligase [Alphaproteobacteria bacterium]